MVAEPRTGWFSKRQWVNQTHPLEPGLVHRPAMAATASPIFSRPPRPLPTPPGPVNRLDHIYSPAYPYRAPLSRPEYPPGRGSFGSFKPCQIAWSSFESARSAEFACTILCYIKLLLSKVYDPADEVLLMMRSPRITVRT